MTITAPIIVSTIGQVIDGPELIEQGTEDVNGVNFRTGSEDLSPGGPGTYLNGILNMKLRALVANTGVGLSVGDLSEATHNGDYFHGENLFLTGWQTSIHLHSMAMSWLRNVLVTNSPETPGDFGVRVTGGSANSHFWQGLTMAHVGIGVSFETPGCGNVIMPGDMGVITGSAFDLYTGSQTTVVGGNSEDSHRQGVQCAVECGTAHRWRGWAGAAPHARL